jgi:hypothetical protein
MRSSLESRIGFLFVIVQEIVTSPVKRFPEMQIPINFEGSFESEAKRNVERIAFL